MTAIAVSSRFSMGSVLTRSFGLLFGNLVSILVLAGAVTIPAILLCALVFVVSIGSAMALGSGDGAILFGSLTLWFLVVLTFHLTTAVIIHAVFQSLRHHPVQLMASLGAGGRQVLAIFLLSLIYVIGVGLGMVALVVPGIILAMAWYVAVPSCVVERLGPLASLSRSWELTRGRRWEVFGLLFVVGLASGIGSVIIQSVAGLMPGEILGSLMVLAWNVLFLTYSAVLVTVTYHDLRVESDGVDGDEIAALFA